MTRGPAALSWSPSPAGQRDPASGASTSDGGVDRVSGYAKRPRRGWGLFFTRLQTGSRHLILRTGRNHFPTRVEFAYPLRMVLSILILTGQIAQLCFTRGEEDFNFLRAAFPSFSTRNPAEIGRSCSATHRVGHVACVALDWIWRRLARPDPSACDSARPLRGLTRRAQLGRGAT